MSKKPSFTSEYEEIARKAWRVFRRTHGLNSYASILALAAWERIGKFTRNDAILEESKQLAREYLSGHVPSVSGAYNSYIYQQGGNATAWLLARGYLPEAEQILVAAAERLCREFPRDDEGLFIHPNRTDNLLWIDTVFGVCPFLVWVGRATGRNEFIEESVHQMLGHHRALFDPATKLYHQARFGGKLSAVWSRGVGWGVYALAELCYDLPQEFPRRDEVRDAFRAVIDGCLAVQDADGMFHQCMEDSGSYPESSGTGLVLYGMGRGIKNGSLDRKKMVEPFLRGLHGLLRCIALDGSIYHCCTGCLAPGEATIASYAMHPWKCNDIHAAGPVILAFGQAEQLYRNQLIPSFDEAMNEER